MKNQQNFIGYILLGVIVVGVAISVYMWGIPIVQKSSYRAQINAIESQISDLANSISSAAFEGTSKTYTISGSKMNVYSSEKNRLEISVDIGTRYYLTTAEIPINYNIFIRCDPAHTIVPIGGSEENLCGYTGLRVTTNSTHFKIYDPIIGKEKVFPLGNYEMLITSIYTFKVSYDGSSIKFTPTALTGIYGDKNYPPCIINALQTENIITYKLQCRPLFSFERDECYLVEPYYNGASSGNKIGFSIIYKESRVNQTYSTVCSSLRIYKVDVNIG